MAKILGLDLGTNSIGWAVVDNISKTIDAGVTTFQRGVAVKQDGSNEEPLNVAKRKARQMRRQVFYKNYRLTKMTEVLARFGMFPYLKVLENEQQQKAIIREIKDRFGLSEQEIKNHGLNKFKDDYQLNARIAKLLLLFGVVGKKPSEINIKLEKNPETLDEFIDHMLEFISMDSYRLRSIALTGHITKMEFGRILYQIGKRRGFKSSRKVKNKDEGDDKTVKNKFKKNDKKKNWQDEVSKLQEKYGDELKIEETETIVEVEYPKALTEFYAEMDETRKAIEKGKYITLGNYLYHKITGDKNFKDIKGVHERRIRQETKADRQMYIDEFNELWNRHSERLGLNILSGEKRTKKKERVEVTLYEFLGNERKGILFYQRPLKSQKHLVAKCTFANKTVRIRDKKTNEILKSKKGKELVKKVGKSRCLVSHPLYERFRALQQINNLKINRNGTWDELSPAEREELLALFTTECNESGKVAISKVLEILVIKKEQLKGTAEGDVEEWKNGEEQQVGSFAGNYTSKKLSELFGTKWDDFKSLPEAVKQKIEKKIIRKIGGENILHNPEFRDKNKDERKRIIEETGRELWSKLTDGEKEKKCLEFIHEEIWHCFTYYEDNHLLFNKLKTYGLDDDKEGDLKKINLKSGYGSLSIKAIRKILPFMEDGLKYTDAVFLANIDEVFGREKWLHMSEAEKQNIHEDISAFIKEKQEEKLEQTVKNAVLKAIKTEYEKKPKPVPALDKVRIGYWTQKKATKFLKEIKGINENGKLSEAIENYKAQIKALLKNPIKPEFLRTEPVVDLIRNHLKEKYNVDEQRLDRLWHPAKVEHLPPSPNELPEPKFQTLRNPIVKQALYALRSAIKHIEAKYGKQDVVRIELARELNDKNKRIAIRRWNKKQEQEREKIRKRLAEYPNLAPINEKDILRYKLWQELQEINGCHECPYTGETICFDDLFGDKRKFDFEHIIPRSRCWSDADVNLTLCATHFNEFKDDRTPFELQECENLPNYKSDWAYDRIKQRVDGWRKKAESLTAEIDKITEDLKGKPASNYKDRQKQRKHELTFERNYYRSKYRRFEIDNLSKDLNDDEEYLRSLITDTGYISRLATIYLKSYFGKEQVQTVKGATTTMLREEWDLGDKNRDNHFHHAEDAIIIAFTNLGVYQELAQHRKKEKTKSTLYHPWSLNEFKDKFVKAVQNIAVYDKQRNKKTNKYNKVIQLKGKKKRIEIDQIRGELHEPLPYREINKGEKYSKRREFKELSNENWKNNIPETLKWEPIEEKRDKKKLINVKIRGIEKRLPLSKLQFLHIPLIEEENIKEVIEQRLKDKNIQVSSSDKLIPKEAFSEKLYYEATAKGKGEIKKCEVLFEGKDKFENRKLTKAEPGKKQLGKLLRLNEIPYITDPAIQTAVISCLGNILKEPKDIDSLKQALGGNFNVFAEAVEKGNFDLDIPLPDVFFEKKLRRPLSNFGIPIKKVTFKERDTKGNRVRKHIDDLTHGDIPNLTEPAKSIIEKRLKEISAESRSFSERLPEEFYEEKIHVPVKNVRTHEKANLYEIRDRAYFRFGKGNIHATVWQDTETEKYYVETVPFYFVVNPDQYDENTRIEFIQGIGKKEIDNGEFKMERLMKIEKFQNGNFFILNTKGQKNEVFAKEVNEMIENERTFKLQEMLYKVKMISSTSFDIQLRKHSSSKSTEGNINIKSSDRWRV
ncbi:MAG: type II CRISPR RNA-guided endonuclease Cas9 [Bacteroidia bacterium]